MRVLHFHPPGGVRNSLSASIVSPRRIVGGRSPHPPKAAAGTSLRPPVCPGVPPRSRLERRGRIDQGGAVRTRTLLSAATAVAALLITPVALAAGGFTAGSAGLGDPMFPLRWQRRLRRLALLAETGLH